MMAQYRLDGSANGLCLHLLLPRSGDAATYSATDSTVLAQRKNWPTNKSRQTSTTKLVFVVLIHSAYLIHNEFTMYGVIGQNPARLVNLCSWQSGSAVGALAQWHCGSRVKAAES